MVGTLAPAALTGPASMVAFDGGVEGSGDGRHVALLQADPAKWQSFDEVLRCQPGRGDQPIPVDACSSVSTGQRSSMNGPLGRFRQFRLNLPGDPVDLQPLVTTAEWDRVCARPVPDREGSARDSGRSWGQSVLVCCNRDISDWPDRSMGACPWNAEPSLAEQEHADHVADGSYSELVSVGRV